MDIIIRQKNIYDISVLEMFKPDDTKKPMIILYHGYLGHKEFILTQAYNLARMDFFVVIPDAYDHGERNLSGNPADFFQTLSNTTGEVNKIIENYNGSEEADIERVGLAGFSMGGCLIFNYLTQEDIRIKAAVTVIGTPDWVSIVKTEEAMKLFKTTDIIKNIDEMHQLQKIALQVQPKGRIKSLRGASLLMLNGEEDPIIPLAQVKEFYMKLRETCKNENSIVLKTYPGIGHFDTLEMNMELLQWFSKHLQLRRY
jgi:dienelactone hydrolase